MSELIREAVEPSLRRRDLDPDPFIQFGKWYEDAINSVPKLPNAMTLATSTADGRASARMVLLKDFDHRGFVFYTNYESRKCRELEANPLAVLVFYWAELDRQVRITGRVHRTTREESAEYFSTRPRESQIAAWASEQSAVIESRDALEKKFDEHAARFEGRDVPLPPFWGGYRLDAEEIEFWQSRTGRLHDRFRYRRHDDGWLIERLSP
ncbi:MAG TPA: pyridoxamine 5'-phosphate oxidase [Blastocatellia bacterium]